MNKTFLDLRNDDDWLLNSLSSDLDKTHEMTAYRLWAQIDAADTSFTAQTVNCAYLEIAVNGEYRGLYLLQTRLDAKQTQLRKASDILYKSSGTNLPEDGELQNVPIPLEAGGVRIVYAPPEQTGNPWDPLRRYRDFFFAKGARALTWYEAAAVANLPNLMDFHLFKQASYAVDNAVKNVFYLADGSANGRITKIPWDLNYTFGDDYQADGRERTYYQEAWAEQWQEETEIDVLFSLNHRQASALLAERWRMLSETVLSTDNIRALMLDSFQEIWDSGAFRRNTQRWTAIEPYRSYEEWMARFDVILTAYEQKWQQIDQFVQSSASAYETPDQRALPSPRGGQKNQRRCLWNFDVRKNTCVCRPCSQPFAIG